MTVKNDLRAALEAKQVTSGVIQEVTRGKATVKTSKGAIVTAHNANAGYAVGDRVTLQNGTVVEKISSGEGKTVYLV